MCVCVCVYKRVIPSHNARNRLIQSSSRTRIFTAILKVIYSMLTLVLSSVTTCSLYVDADAIELMPGNVSLEA